MAFPLELTDIFQGTAARVPPCGPFQSSAGDYYIFGASASDSNNLIAIASSDPSSSWSVTDTVTTCFNNDHSALNAYQVGDIIHTVTHLSSGTGADYIKYQAYDMSSNTFTIEETVVSSYDPYQQTQFWATAIVYRTSNNQPVVFYNGPSGAIMGNDYTRVYYARRTGTNTWTTNQAVDAAGALNYQIADAVLGSSNRTHLFWAANYVYHRTLASNNQLQTIYNTTYVSTATYGHGALSFDDEGTQVIACFGTSNTLIFDSADVPSYTEKDGSDPGAPHCARLFNDGTDMYILFIGSIGTSLLYRKSTDQATTWPTYVNLYSRGGTAPHTEAVGRRAQIYTRGSDVILPWIVWNPTGTAWFLGEAVVRTTTAVAPISSLQFGPPFF